MQRRVQRRVAPFRGSRYKWGMLKTCSLALVLLLGCGDDGADPIDIQVDTFNVALAGAFIPEEAAGRAMLAIATDRREHAALEGGDSGWRRRRARLRRRG